MSRGAVPLRVDGASCSADVVVAGVCAYELVSLIDRDPLALGGDPLGLFDDDP
jgi:hypothetical protein